jgi:hypothetical protein
MTIATSLGASFWINRGVHSAIELSCLYAKKARTGVRTEAGAQTFVMRKLGLNTVFYLLAYSGKQIACKHDLVTNSRVTIT